MRKPITIDFETKAILPRPDYPPKPVGVAIWVPGSSPKYWAWGHPTNNNTTFEAIRTKLLDLWSNTCRHGRTLLFHNAPFDLEVAQEHFDLPYPRWNRIHDTMLLCFLLDPHAQSLELKVMANKLLNMPPEEQDELKQWIFDHVPGAKGAKKQWGAHISKTPGDLCGRYAVGDVVRTRKLFDYTYSRIGKASYNRERELEPILLQAEETGVKIAKQRLKKDVKAFENNLSNIDERIRIRLKAPDLEIDKTRDLATAIDSRNLVKEWPMTPKGQRSVAAKALVECCTDKNLVNLLLYRGRLKTGLRSFGRPWLDRSYDGRMHSHWNQVVNEEGVKKYGARTGRLSSNPNLQNLAKDRIEPMPGFPALPHPREYIVPEKGHILLGRDYAQQELRILAYMIGGAIAERYRKDPTLDLHEYAQQAIYENFGFELPRKSVKMIAFGMIYGMGAPSLSRKLGLEIDESRTFIGSYIETIPGFQDLRDQIKSDRCITTWGGRFYEAEKPITETRKVNKWGHGIVEQEFIIRDFVYKLLNYLIQGSAAECTKQAIINHHNNKEHGTFLLSAHDELLIESPKEHREDEMFILEQSMRDVNFKPIAMLSDGKYSYRNWAQMRNF